MNGTKINHFLKNKRRTLQQNKNVINREIKICHRNLIHLFLMCEKTQLDEPQWAQNL